MDPKRVAARFREAAGYHHTEGERFWGRAGAGALLRAADTGRVLLVRRSRLVEQPGTWSAPGGAIEEGESPVKAALSELREEVGFSGHVSLTAGYVFRKGSFQYHNFWGTVAAEFRPRLNWESDKAEWFDLSDLPTPLHPGFRTFIEHDSDRISGSRKTAGYDQYNLESVAEMFADQAHYPLGSCDMNRGDCEMMSNVLLEWLGTVTLPDGFQDLAGDLARASLIAGTGFKKPLGRDAEPMWLDLGPGSLSHVVVRVGPWVIDMTGKQFGSQYADPIYPFSTFRQRWAKTRRINKATPQMNAIRWQMLQAN
jgi:8-oxo-dGTP pyrophosphatase MutT (NUDIX family)